MLTFTGNMMTELWSQYIRKQHSNSENMGLYKILYAFSMSILISLALLSVGLIDKSALVWVMAIRHYLRQHSVITLTDIYVLWVFCFVLKDAFAWLPPSWKSPDSFTQDRKSAEEKRTQLKQVKVLKKCRRIFRSPKKYIHPSRMSWVFSSQTRRKWIFFENVPRSSVSRKLWPKLKKYKKIYIFRKFSRKSGIFQNFVTCKYHDILCWWYVGLFRDGEVPDLRTGLGYSSSQYSSTEFLVLVLYSYSWVPKS